MATVRISGNWRNTNKREWAGAPAIDEQGHIDRSINIPEEAYQAIEREIAKGGNEGFVSISSGAQFHWFVDR